MSFIQALQEIFYSPVVETAATGGTTCFLVSVLIVLTKKLHVQVLERHVHHGIEHVAVPPHAVGVKPTRQLAVPELGDVHMAQFIHGSIPLEIIEVQSGSYLGEDDIVRFEDAYSRVG